MSTATKVKRGDRRTFRSTLQGEDGFGVLVHKYSDQTVTVLTSGRLIEDSENLFTVQADDETIFSAWESELIPGGTNVYVNSDGEYVANPGWKAA